MASQEGRFKSGKLRVMSQKWQVKNDNSRVAFQKRLIVTTLISKDLLIKIGYLTLTILDLQKLAKKLLPFATIVRLAIFCFNL